MTLAGFCGDKNKCHGQDNTIHQDSEILSKWENCVSTLKQKNTEYCHRCNTVKSEHWFLHGDIPKDRQIVILVILWRESTGFSMVISPKTGRLSYLTVPLKTVKNSSRQWVKWSTSYQDLPTIRIGNTALTPSLRFHSSRTLMTVECISACMP